MLNYIGHWLFIMSALQWVVIFALMVANGKVQVMEPTLWIKCLETCTSIVVLIFAIYWFIHDVKSYNRRNQND